MDEILESDSARPTNLPELYYIYPPLPTFDLTHKGLRSPETLGKRYLAELDTPTS